MTVRTGSLGAVNGISAVRNWTVEETTEPKKAINSGTRNGTAVKAGVRQWKGTFSQHGHTPIVMPGEIFSFIGYKASTTDTRNTTGPRVSGSAIVDSVAITWNWETNDLLNIQTSFSGHLGLTEAPSGAAVLDATDPTLVTPCGTKIEWGATPTELTDLVSATLTITAANKQYVNSSTFISGDCWAGRKPGAIDWSLAVVQQSDLMVAASIPTIKSNEILKIYVNATDYWELKWAHLSSITGITVDVETQSILAQTLNFTMNGNNPGIGYIRKPGAVTDWWPA